MQWNSVKHDGLPKNEDSYVVVVRTFNHGLLERRQDMIMEFKDGGFRNNAYLNERCYEVTHWAHRLDLSEED